MKTLEMRKRKTTGLPPMEPDALPEVAEPPEEKAGVKRRRRIPQKEVTEALGGESTATRRLEKIVGTPPETEPADVTLRKLEKAYIKYGFNPDDVFGSFESALKSVSGVNAGEATIQAFIDRKLPAYEDEEDFREKAGIFLSAVLAESTAQKITLNLTKLPELSWLCCFLKNKDVTIIGDVGNWTAFGAESGTVTVKGNAGHGTGDGLKGASVIVEGNTGNDAALWAESGTVTIKGSAGGATGRRLKGASVIVEGNTGNQTAFEAESGVIRIGGKIKSLAENISKNVKVFEADKQVWPKRK